MTRVDFLDINYRLSLYFRKEQRHKANIFVLVSLSGLVATMFISIKESKICCISIFIVSLRNTVPVASCAETLWQVCVIADSKAFGITEVVLYIAISRCCFISQSNDCLKPGLSELVFSHFV